MPWYVWVLLENDLSESSTLIILGISLLLSQYREKKSNRGLLESGIDITWDVWSDSSNWNKKPSDNTNKVSSLNPNNDHKESKKWSSNTSSDTTRGYTDTSFKKLR